MNPPEGMWERRRRQARKSRGSASTDGDNPSSIARGCRRWRRKRGSSALRRGAPREGKERPAKNRLERRRWLLVPMTLLYVVWGARELFFAAKKHGLVRKVCGTFAVEVLRAFLSDALRMTISERERHGGRP